VSTALSPLPAAQDLTAVMPQAAPAALSRRQKAAIIVRLVLEEGAALSLADLPEELQSALTEQLGAMRPVDRGTVAAVIEEFIGELDAIGLSFPGGIDNALSMLDGTISPATAARLRRESGLFLPYLEKTLRNSSLNALKSLYGDWHHGGLFACSENNSCMRRVRNQFVNRT